MGEHSTNGLDMMNIWAKILEILSLHKDQIKLFNVLHSKHSLSDEIIAKKKKVKKKQTNKQTSKQNKNKKQPERIKNKY